jgi:hypothetical protein
MDKNMHRIKDNTDLRNVKSRFHCITLKMKEMNNVVSSLKLKHINNFLYLAQTSIKLKPLQTATLNARASSGKLSK